MRTRPPHARPRGPCVPLLTILAIAGLASPSRALTSPPPSAAARAAASARAQAAPAKRALVIGVGAYPPSSRWPALSGPPADARAFASVLVERLGFAREDVRLLLDERATRAAILQGWEELVRASRPGDLLAFYFAGHGSRVPDQAGEGRDEADGYDETLVPFDAQGDPREGWRDLRDDELERLIARANEVTDQVVLVLDCCSSGTATRAAGLVPRYLEPRARGFEGARPSAAPPEGRLSGWVPPKLRYVSLSACLASQSAYEIALGEGDEPRRPRGVFTHALVEALEEAGTERGAEFSYADLLARVEARVRARVEGQTPLVEGPLYGYRCFGLELGERTPRFGLSCEPGGALRVEGGALEGLAEEDELVVLHDGALRASAAESLGRVALTRIGARSAARWLGPGAPPPAGRYSAFLARRGPRGPRMPLRLEAPAEHASAPGSAWTASRLLDARADADAPYALALRDAPRRWRLETRDGLALPLEARADDPQAQARLAAELERLALAWRVARTLASGTAAEPAVGAQLLRVEQGAVAGPLTPREGVHEVEPEHDLALRVWNRSSLAAHVQLVAILPDAEVLPWWRTSPEEPLRPGEERLLPAFSFDCPPGLEAWWRVGAIELVLVSTATPRDLAVLAQDRVRVLRADAHGARGEEQDARLLAGDRAPFAPEESWNALVLRLRVLSR